MVILTIRFPRGTKTYDYLMVNPRAYKLDRSRVIKLLTGTSRKGDLYDVATLIDGKKYESLPTHVTSVLEIMTDNFVQVYPLSAEEIARLRKPISPPPTPIAEEDGWIEKTVTKEEFIQKVGYKSYLALSFSLREQIEKGAYTISVYTKRKEK